MSEYKLLSHNDVHELQWRAEDRLPNPDGPITGKDLLRLFGDWYRMKEALEDIADGACLHEPQCPWLVQGEVVKYCPDDKIIAENALGRSNG
jgi:hypothetical protein